MDRRKFITNSAVGVAGLAIIPQYSNAAVNSGASIPSNHSNGKSLIDGNNLILNPADNQKALINPMMGWTHYHYSCSISNYCSM